MLKKINFIELKMIHFSIIKFNFNGILGLAMGGISHFTRKILKIAQVRF